VCEKYLEKQNEVFVAFMDLEKVYDRVDRMAMWEVLRMYVVGDKILSVIKSMYEKSMVCVKIGQSWGGSLKWMGCRTASGVCDVLMLLQYLHW
jgi:hypothetical protein